MDEPRDTGGSAGWQRRHAPVQPSAYRLLTGLAAAGICAIGGLSLYLGAAELVLAPVENAVVIAAFVGWFGLAYACLYRPRRITPEVLDVVLMVSVAGAVITQIVSFRLHVLAGLAFTGVWLANALGVAWLVAALRRTRRMLGPDRDDEAAADDGG